MSSVGIIDTVGGGTNGSNGNPMDSCTVTTCEISTSQYQYRISIVANALFVGLFGVSLFLFVVTYFNSRKSGFTRAFLIAMVLGLVTEIIGYAGRIMSWQNQWSQNGFLIQICCLTIGPAFLSAGIYVCLRRIVSVLGEDASRIPPVWYTRIFIPCDIVSLLLQATGGGMAASESKGSSGSVDKGNNIMIAGLSFQVFTLLIFICLTSDFLIRVFMGRGHLQPRNLSSQPVSWCNLWGFTGFYGILVALGVSTICIFMRSVYRVAELSEGWTGPLMARQDLFIGFEGALITIGVLILNLWHPALVLTKIESQHFELIRSEEIKLKYGVRSDFEMGSLVSHGSHSGGIQEDHSSGAK